MEIPDEIHDIFVVYRLIPPVPYLPVHHFCIVKGPVALFDYFFMAEVSVGNKIYLRFFEPVEYAEYQPDDCNNRKCKNYRIYQIGELNHC